MVSREELVSILSQETGSRGSSLFQKKRFVFLSEGLSSSVSSFEQDGQYLLFSE